MCNKYYFNTSPKQRSKADPLTFSLVHKWQPKLPPSRSTNFFFFLGVEKTLTKIDV